MDLAGLISTELGVEDDSAFTTPEAMRAAIAAVLDLKPPPHSYLTDGWWSCHAAVVRAIAEQLGLLAEVTE